MKGSSDDCFRRSYPGVGVGESRTQQLWGKPGLFSPAWGEAIKNARHFQAPRVTASTWHTAA
jgi:hypothetical protein